ncbi:uncharacterized protein LOC125043107 [Penaeus chinensis]|uniref:uncharacterized protein LOC125043107 n=1 Tax=Penaeus chinensis TaxID=139456 RepID=UPI001FB78B53|nr:uncharacterized protein LOC125043107 [Penaeus chinensis]
MTTVSVGMLLALAFFIYRSAGLDLTSVRFQVDGKASTESMLDAGIGFLPNLTQVTFCTHFRMEHSSTNSPILSYSTEFDEEFLIGFSNIEEGIFRVTCCAGLVSIWFPDRVTLYEWRHMCVALDSGISKLWLNMDGVFSEAALPSAENVLITGGGRLVFGQELDSLDGGFDINQSLDGQLVDLRIYDVALTVEEMRNFVECDAEKISHTPILTLDSDVLEVKGSTLLSRRPEEEVCQNKPYRTMFFPESRSKDEASLWCRMFKGSLSVPSNAEENKSIRDAISSTFKTQCTNCYGCRYWLGMKGDPASGAWIRDSDGETVSWINGKYQRPTNHAQCMTASVPNFPYAWLQTPCNLYFCTLCIFSSTPKVRLLGLCKTSLFDSQLHLHGYANGRPRFNGLKHTAIEWSNGTWVMTSRLQEGLNASMEMSSLGDYPLGLHRWHVRGDKCRERVVDLLLTACSEDKYTCGDGACISKHRRCNSIADCSDNKDELNCSVLRIPTGYRKERPPTAPSGGPLDVELVIDISSIKKFDLVNFKIIFNARVTLKWRDARLTYLSLQDDYYTNRVKDQRSIWKPILFIRDEVGIVSYEFSRSALYVNRTSVPILDDDQILTESYAFSGATNILVHEQEGSLTIMCYYNLHKYPFDTQICFFYVSVADLTTKFGFLAQDSAVSFEGRRELLEYELFSERLEFLVERNISYAKVQFVFKNRYVYYIGNAFTPSLMMVIICFLTFHFDLEDFQDRIMVSLTSLLVLVTFFSQTSQSIPKTSYVKLIDAWYLSLIAEDLLAIMALVYIERMRLREKKLAPKEKRERLYHVSKPAKMNQIFLFLFPTSLVLLLSYFIFMFVSSFSV